MAKQTRRSISLNGATYQRLKLYLEQQGLSISGFIEDLVESKLGPASEEDRRKFAQTEATRQAQKVAEQEAKENHVPDNDDYVPPILLL